MKSIEPENLGDFGFQIAPMIDVVFVIMLFFMVMAGGIKVENHLVANLPGEVRTDRVDFVDETVISVGEGGEVALNDEPMDSPTVKDLKQLKASLNRLRQNSDNAHNQCLVTIDSEPLAKYGRVVDVLDALTDARITNVTMKEPHEID